MKLAHTDAPAVDTHAAPAEPAEEAVPPPRFRVTFSDGQESVIAVDYACAVQIIDPFGVIKATVALAGVDAFALEL